MIRKTVAIDIGSTNSQMIRVFEQRETENDAWTPIKNSDGTVGKIFLDSENNTINFPSVILRKSDLTEEQLPTNDIEEDYFFGGKAETKSNKLYGGTKIISEFKKDFFANAKYSDNDEAKASHKIAAENIGLFLRFFKELEAKETQNSACSQERLILTMPVRSTATEKEEMIELAEKAGWKNIEISDEATSAFRYFLSVSNSPLLKSLSNLTKYQHLKVLLMDLGGLTTDILVAEISPDGKGGFQQPKILGQWPEIGTQKTLGGTDVDESICDWLLKGGYLIPEVVKTNKKLAHRYIRNFKDNYINETISDNNPVKALIGDIVKLSESGRRETLVYSENFYDKMENSKKIGRTIYLNEIVKKYFTEQQNAIRELLEYCDTKEKDIDFICLSGGGSNLLGLKELLLGELKDENGNNIMENPLNFEKIKTNPAALISVKKTENMEPSAVCAAGAVAHLPYINFKFFCPYKWSMTVDIYKGKAGTLVEYDQASATIDPNLFKELTRVYNCDYTLAEEKKTLPIDLKVEKDNILLNRNDDEAFIYAIYLYSQKGSGAKVLQMAKTSYSCRTPIQTLKALGNKVKNFFGLESNSKNKCTASYSVGVFMNESRCITLDPNFKGEGIWGFNNGKTKTQG